MTARKLVFFALITACIIFGWVAIAPQETLARSYHYNSVDVDITVNKDSTMDVVERFDINFDGIYHGVFREITLVSESNKARCRSNPALQCGGFDWIVVNNIIGEGRELSPTEYRYFNTFTNSEDRLRVEWEFSPDGRNFRSESFKWEIHYRVLGGVDYFDDYDLFYWNALFPDREVDIKSSSINISFPSDITFSQDDLRIEGGVSYLQQYDSNSATLELDPDEEISPHEDFTIVLKFPKSIVNEYGEIEVRGTPALVFTTVSGEDIVISDASNSISGLPAGEYEVGISAIGFLSETKNVSVRAGETTNIEISLVEAGSILVHLTPQDGEVYVDGVLTSLDTNNKILGLDEGEYSLTFKADGYFDQERKVSVELGETTEISIELEKTPLTIAIEILIATCNICACLLAPVLGGIVIWRYVKYGRDPKIRKAIAPEFKPPNNIPPVLLGSLKDEKVDMVDITSTIINSAYKGYIHIKELGKKNYELKKQKSFDDLESLEKFIMEKIFGSKESVKTNSLKNTFYKKIPDIKDHIFEAMVEYKYFERRPDTVRKIATGIGIAIIIIGVILSVALTTVEIFTLGPSVILTGILLLTLAQFMPAKTKLGAEVLHKVKGFKMYLETAERYTLQNLTPELFERFLAYAIVFGVEKKWAKNFEDIYTSPPDWYEGDSWTTFNTLLLADALSSMDTSVASAMSVAPSSSGSSFGGGGWSGGGGFSGGFSGGGGGGGGGGAW